MSTGSDWTHPADERILRYLTENPPDYLPLVANRLGMHLDYVERRVDALVEHGLLEPVNDGVVYVVTERGERYLTEEAASVSLDGDP